MHHRASARLAGAPEARRRHPHADEDRTLERRLSRAAEGNAILRITVREGRNRQVRKMLDAIGHPVDHLERVAIGPIRDSRLKPGQWRELTREEVKKLRASAQTTRPRPGKDANPRPKKRR